jgi:hypothetical protein
MGEEQGAVRAPVGSEPEQPSPEQLRADIEGTREDLGETVAALAEKTDVKARAKDKVAELRERVTEKRTQLAGGGGDSGSEGGGESVAKLRAKAEDNPVPTAAVAAFVGGVVFGRLTKRG